jgi:hypothetical protein
MRLPCRVCAWCANPIPGMTKPQKRHRIRSQPRLPFALQVARSCGHVHAKCNGRRHHEMRVRLKPELLALAIEGAGVDPQEASGVFTDRTAFEDQANMLSLELFQGHRPSDFDSGRGF